MTGRNPWDVLRVAEDAPIHEVRRAFRRRVKQTHPDGGGDAAEFGTVVVAFDQIRRHSPTPCRQRAPRTTPYDGWIESPSTTRCWSEEKAAPSGGTVLLFPGPGRIDGEFNSILADELARAQAIVG
ncbi:MAG: J domain-containing protein [Acidimicrobiales bacterium]